MIKPCTNVPKSIYVTQVRDSIEEVCVVVKYHSRPCTNRELFLSMILK